MADERNVARVRLPDKIGKEIRDTAFDLLIKHPVLRSRFNFRNNPYHTSDELLVEIDRMPHGDEQLDWILRTILQAVNIDDLTEISFRSKDHQVATYNKETGDWEREAVAAVTMGNHRRRR